ncbi:MAG: heavy-metal-associated domain-containing protein [Thermodesulfobacteriota bacterium]
MEKIKIKGMTCQHCVLSVTKALATIPGLKNIQVDLQREEATYENFTNVSREVIKQAIEDAGYKVID